MDNLYEECFESKLIILINDKEGFCITPITNAFIFFKALKENTVSEKDVRIIKVNRKNITSFIEYADYIYDEDNDVELKG